VISRTTAAAAFASFIGLTGCAQWVAVESPSELRAIYSDTTHHGKVYGRSNAAGTPYVGRYRADGTATVEIDGRRFERSWEIKGHNMMCGRSRGGSSPPLCYRVVRNKTNPNEYQAREVSRDLSTQFTVEGAGDLRERTHAAGPELSGYTCCNLFYNVDRISDANWSSTTMLPAGTPIRTVTYLAYSIEVQVGEAGYVRSMFLDQDYGRNQGLADWARKLIVQEDPRLNVASWPAPARNAIRTGKIAVGMTKEQVIVALGYPPTHETPFLNAAQWRYWYGRFDDFLVTWDPSGRVKDVIAEPQTRSAVMLSGTVGAGGR